MRVPFPLPIACVAALVMPAVHDGTPPPAARAQVASQADQREAIRHYREGQALMYQEAFDRAAAEYRQAIQYDPLLTLAHYGLGQARMELAQYPEAVAAFEACRSAYQRIGELAVRNTVAADRVRQDEMRELNETIRAIRSGRFKVDQPENSILRIEARLRELDGMRQRGHLGVTVPVEVIFSLGSAYFRAGRLADAEREWTTAVGIDETFGEAWNNLAALYLMTGRATLAGEAVARAERAGFPVNPNLKADIRRAGGG